MENKLYKEVLEYLQKKNLPQTFTSSKGNFVALCNKYKINKKGWLTRNGKPVVKESMQVI